jgi:putative membrane protein
VRDSFLESASASMAKRFQLLFVLPKSFSAIVLAYLTVVLLIALSYEYAFGLQIPSSALVFIFVAICQALVLQVVRGISNRLSSVATPRRIAASLCIVNAVWLSLTLVMLTVKGFNHVAAPSIFIFSSFVALAFGILIFWPVFTDTLLLAAMISAVNLLPLSARYAIIALTSVNLSGLLSSAALGASFLAVVLTTLAWINGSAKKRFGLPSFRLLKTFLDAWTNLNGLALESQLSSFTQEGSASTYLFEFTTDERKKIGVVVPEVHPGPFAPVGSYDLPGRIHWYLKERGYDECYVLHGAVDHSLNLMSSQDVGHFLSQLTVPPANGVFNNKISMPLKRESGDAVITGIRVGDSLCIFVSVPKGSEDYPSSFRESVNNLCSRIGYRKVILVDAHDSIGGDPSDKLQADALEGIKQVASELFSAPQHEFSLGFSNKLYTFTSIAGADIGSGGIGCLAIGINGINYALISADSNNSLPGLRGDIERTLASKSIQLLEFCTSDSHFNAARIRNRRGYLVLGESSSPTKIVEDVADLADRAVSGMVKASLGFYEWVAHVQLPRANLLEQLETTLTTTINATKNGLSLMLGLMLVDTIIMLLL